MPLKELTWNPLSSDQEPNPFKTADLRMQYCKF